MLNMNRILFLFSSAYPTRRVRIAFPGSSSRNTVSLPISALILTRVGVSVCSVWVPCVALPSGGGSSAGSSPLCGSPVGGVLPCRVPVSRGICSSSCLSLALTLSLLVPLVHSYSVESRIGLKKGFGITAGKLLTLK